VNKVAEFTWPDIRATVREMASADPHWSKAYRIYARWVPSEHGQFVNSILGRVEDLLEEYEERNRDEAERILREEYADQAAYNKDIYAYHGCRRSDFS